MLQRPSFATGALKALALKSIENFDPRTHCWGADGIGVTFLDKLVTCVKGGSLITAMYLMRRRSAIK